MKKAVLIFFILLITLAAVVGVWYFSGGFGGATPTVLVKYDGISYIQSADLGGVCSGAEFKVYAIGEYKIRIEAHGGSEIAFTVGEEEYSWSDLEGKEMTNCFEIEQTSDGFSLRYSGFESILSSYFGTEVFVSEMEMSPSFDLIVESVSELRLTFSLSKRIESIMVSPDHIYF